jgi:hypothetical protein
MVMDVATQSSKLVLESLVLELSLWVLAALQGR